MSSSKNPLEGLIPTEPIVLSERDFVRLIDASENPPEPNEALLKAMRNYERHVIELDDDGNELE